MLAPALRSWHWNSALGIELLKRNVTVGIWTVEDGCALIDVCGTSGTNFRIVATSFCATSNAYTSPLRSTAPATGSPGNFPAPRVSSSLPDGDSLSIRCLTLEPAKMSP